MNPYVEDKAMQNTLKKLLSESFISLTNAYIVILVVINLLFLRTELW